MPRPPSMLWRGGATRCVRLMSEGGGTALGWRGGAARSSRPTASAWRASDVCGHRVQAAARRRASIKVADEQRDRLRSLADAATSVEKHFRGLMGRRASATLMNANTRAATTIEAAQRGRFGRQIAAEMRAIDAEERAATRLPPPAWLRGRRQSVAVAAEAREAPPAHQGAPGAAQPRRHDAKVPRPAQERLEDASDDSPQEDRRPLRMAHDADGEPCAMLRDSRARPPSPRPPPISLYPSGNTSEGYTHLSPRPPPHPPVTSPRTPHLSGARRERRRSRGALAVAAEVEGDQGEAGGIGGDGEGAGEGGGGGEGGAGEGGSREEGYGCGEGGRRGDGRR